MLTIDVTDHISAALLEKAQRFPAAVERALDATTRAVEQEADRQVGRIYSRPIPRSKTGRALWRRTGKLRGSRTVQAAPWARTISWSVAYANRRFTLGVTWKPRNPAGGVIRKNPAPQDTARIVAPWAARYFAQELENLLND